MLLDNRADVRLPSWSSDGDRIAFQSYRSGYWQIWIVNADGSDPQQLTRAQSDHRDPVWSPDGQSIYFSSDRNGNYDIWSINLSDGSLAAHTDSIADEFSPAFLGKRLVYLSNSGQRGSATQAKEVVDGKGGDRVLHSVDGSNVTGLTGSYDGSTLYYIAYDDQWTAEQVSLVKVDVASGVSSMVAPDADDIFPFRPSLDRAGIIYFTADGGIYAANTDGEARSIAFDVRLDIGKEPRDYHRVTSLVESGEDYPVKGVVSPRLSPDGRSVTFQALGDVWVTNWDGVSRRVSSGQGVDAWPVFGPAGDYLAFVADSDSRWELRVTHLESVTDTTTLYHSDKSLAGLSWSRDGEWLAFLEETRMYGGYSQALKLVRVATGAVQTLEEGLFGISRPAWSPNGKMLAYHALEKASKLYREGKNILVIRDIASGATRTIAPPDGSSFAARPHQGPAWSPVGDQLATVMDGRLHILDPSDRAGSITPLLSERVDGDLSWSADGSQLLLQREAELILVDVESGERRTWPANMTWKRDPADREVVYHIGRLFDGISESYQHDVDVVVRGDTIVSVSPHSAERGHSGSQVVDLRDKTVLPGLIDYHVHVMAQEGVGLGKQLLSYGITTIREPGGFPYAALERRESWESGARPGPHLFFTGPLLDGARVYYPIASPTADKDSLRHELEKGLRLDYDFYKTYVRLPDDFQKIVVDFAHRNGLSVASHELFPAAGFGVDHKEHLKGTHRDGFGMSMSLKGYMYEDVIEIFGATRMSVTPTAALLCGIALTASERPGYFAEHRFNELFPRHVREDFLERQLPAFYGDKSPELLVEIKRRIQRGLRRILDAGGKVIAGTDSPIIPYGVSLLSELAFYVGERGLTEREAILSATVWPAEALGLGDRLGHIKPGSQADMIVVDGDPLEDINDLSKLEGVVKSGQFLDPRDWYSKAVGD